VIEEQRMSRLNLTARQRQRLRRQLAETADAHRLRRTLAVLEFDGGRPIGDLARMLGVPRRRVADWIESYTRGRDPAALRDEPAGGRRAALDEDAEFVLETLLSDSPQDLGYPQRSWTLPLLLDALEACTRRRLTDVALRGSLERLAGASERPSPDADTGPRRAAGRILGTGSASRKERG